MPSSIFFGMQHLNQNLLCAIGMATTGLDPEKHDIVEICVLPMNHFLVPHKDLILFNMQMQPRDYMDIDWENCGLPKKRVAELSVSGIDSDAVAEMFLKWYTDMDMPFRKQLIPLGFNFAKQRPFLYKWLSHEIYHTIFREDYRDVLTAAHFVNDSFDVVNEPVPFAKQDLRWIAKKLNVQAVIQGGSACGDAYTICECYRKLLQTR